MNNLVVKTEMKTSVEKTFKKSPSQTVREELALALARQHYERGNQARSLKMVWRRYAFPQLGICYRTFLNYVRGEI